MTKKLKNIIYKASPLFTLLFIILVWELVSKSQFVPSFILPSFKEVFLAFIKEFDLIKQHFFITLVEAVLGLILSVFSAFIIAILMDKYKIIHKSFYPILIITQTIPTICIAPLIVLWFGFGILPKIILIFLTCFFPILIGILNGFKAVDKEILKLIKSMNASYFQTLFLVKIPLSLNSFFSGLKISASYSIVSAVVAEWLGGEKGLGVYMTRVKKSYNFDKMFASIIIISVTSILLVEIVKKMEKMVVKWEK